MTLVTIPFDIQFAQLYARTRSFLYLHSASLSKNPCTVPGLFLIPICRVTIVTTQTATAEQLLVLLRNQSPATVHPSASVVLYVRCKRSQSVNN